MLNTILSQPVYGGIDYEQEYQNSYLVSVLETIFKFTRDIYIITDNDFSVKYTNSKNISKKTDIFKLLKINPKNLSGRYGEVNKTFSLGNTKIKADITIAKIFTDSKTPDGYMIIIKDKTKSYMTNIYLDRVMNFLQHELKTSIIAQSLGIKALKNIKNNDEILEELENSSENIYRMLKNVIQEVEISENTIIPHKNTVNIKNLFEKTREEVKNFFKSKGNTLLIKYNDNFEFNADEQLLSQVFTTILFHANEGCNKANITISGEKHRSETVIKISGCFITPKRNLFYELKESKNTLSRLGFDNGLFLSSKIIEAHGGKITVSTKNFISSVSIIIPN